MAENVWLWSATAADNDDADAAVPWPENMLPGAVNNAARALMAGVARFRLDLTGIGTAGSADAYTVTSSSGHTALTTNTLITIKANFTNTGAATLNLNTLGAKNIRVLTPGGEAAVSAGQIQSTGRYQLVYDSTIDSAAGGWLLLNPAHTEQIAGIKIWPTDTAPASYLFCNGQAVSRTTYATLFTAISTTFGVGDGATTFNVPDLRGRAPFGTDDMGASAASRVTNAGSGIVGTTLGASGGAETHTLTTAQLAQHLHTVSITSGGASVGHTHTVSITSGGASVDHTHGISITTGVESVNHSHTGTTGTESQSHTHNYNLPDTSAVFDAGGAGGRVTAATATATGTASQTHTHSFTSDGVSANHTHLVSGTSAGQSADHTHLVSGTSGAQSADHTHTVSGNTGNNGSGTAHNNMPPALMLNFIIKAL